MGNWPLTTTTLKWVCFAARLATTGCGGSGGTRVERDGGAGRSSTLAYPLPPDGHYKPLGTEITPDDAAHMPVYADESLLMVGIDQRSARAGRLPVALARATSRSGVATCAPAQGTGSGST